jgi:hypothetical protein
MDDPSLFCDNFSRCRRLYIGRGSPEKTRAAARARGWHFYEGPNFDGSRQLSVSLCSECAQADRRALPKAGAPLEGQTGLFEE